MIMKFVLGPTRPFRCFPLGVANEMNKWKSVRGGKVVKNAKSWCCFQMPCYQVIAESKICSCCLATEEHTFKLGNENYALR